jgi:hypothetical protein
LLGGVRHVIAVADRPHIIGGYKETFGKQETDSELKIVARGAHRHSDRDRLSAPRGESDLKRLLADDLVIDDLEASVS